MEELRRHICIDASSRSCGDSFGLLSSDIELQSLIPEQAGGSGDILSLLATKRPDIVVDENGGQPRHMWILIGSLFSSREDCLQ